jgi:hypothetical protein
MRDRLQAPITLDEFDDQPTAIWADVSRERFFTCLFRSNDFTRLFRSCGRRRASSLARFSSTRKSDRPRCSKPVMSDRPEP